MDLGTFIHFDISIYAILYLSMLFVLIVLRKEIYSVSSKLILWIIATNILILFLEVMSWVIDGTEGELYYVIAYLVNSLLFLFVGLIVAYWMSYVDYIIYRSKDRLQQKRYYFWVVLLTLLFVVINLFVPLLFSINEENTYVQGFFFGFYYFLFVLLFLYSLVMSFGHKENEQAHNVLWMIFLFLGLVIISGMVQSTFYGTILIWPVMALATSVVYIFFETTSNNRDYVTKLYTRMKTDEYMQHLKEDDVPFAVVMIDLDDYKEVNDDFGHVVGDRVLRLYARSLEKVFKEDGMVSRFGGDEFLVVLPEVDEQYLIAKKEMVQSTVRKDLEKLPVDDLQFSYGFSFSSNDKTVEETVIEADNQMYEDKAQNKNFKRRKTD